MWTIIGTHSHEPHSSVLTWLCASGTKHKKQAGRHYDVSHQHTTLTSRKSGTPRLSVHSWLFTKESETKATSFTIPVHVRLQTELCWQCSSISLAHAAVSEIRELTKRLITDIVCIAITCLRSETSNDKHVCTCIRCVRYYYTLWGIGLNVSATVKYTRMWKINGHFR